MKNLFYILIIIFFSSCKKDEIPETIIDTNGVITKLPFLWKTSLTDGGYIAMGVAPSITYNDKILMGTFKEQKCDIALLDVNSGTKIWQTLFYPDQYYASISRAYQYENLLVSDSYSEGFQCRNLDNGHLKWKIITGGWFDGYKLTGIDNLFFVCGKSATNYDPFYLWAGWVGNAETGEMSEFLTPIFSETADTVNFNYYGSRIVGGIENIVPLKTESGEILLLINTHETLQSEYGEYYFSLYNFTKKEFVYCDKKLSASNHGMPQIVDNKIYFTLYKEVCCYDLNSGEKLWGRTYAGGFGSNFIVVNNQLITSEVIFDESFLINLNSENGNQNWSISTVQNLSPLRYLNGVIYFVPLSDAKLHAYEASTGKELWRIESPDYAHDSGAFFKPECTVVPGKNGEKGKVIVSSYLNGFCYEAAR